MHSWDFTMIIKILYVHTVSSLLGPSPNLVELTFFKVMPNSTISSPGISRRPEKDNSRNFLHRSTNSGTQFSQQKSLDTILYEEAEFI